MGGVTVSPNITMSFEVSPVLLGLLEVSAALLLGQHRISRTLHCRVFLLIFLLVEDTMKIILGNRMNPTMASPCLLVFNLQFFRLGG